MALDMETTMKLSAQKMALAMSLALTISANANAQPFYQSNWGGGYVAPQRGGNFYHQQNFQHQNQFQQNFGQRQQLDWRYQNQFSHQNPRAALIGGILGAVATGLQHGNAQKNAGAVNVLGSLSNTFNQLSGPQYRERGQLALQQQGYFNQMQNQRSQFQQRGGYYGW